MKKIALALATSLLIAGFGFAQSPVQPPFQTQTQVTKVTGKLALVQGMIGLQSGSKTYLVPSLFRYAGFIKGIEEGSTVTIEGYERALPYSSDVSFLLATKLTVGGKDYDLGQAGPGALAGRGGYGPMMGRGMMQGWGGGPRGGPRW
jgi:hypothetical protein